MSAARDGAARSGVAAYATVTAAYWALMLTDGALRMLVLLHFHVLGFSPLQLAYLFLLYEAMGVLTNLGGGWVAARFGLAPTLYAGLGLQVAALAALSQLDPGWAVATSVVFVMAVQGAAGVAKDLTKMSAKSAIRTLLPEDAHGRLFRWVALLTGSKNAAKGFGFLLGAGLLAGVGYVPALLGMAAALAAILLAVAVAMPPGLQRGRAKVPFREVFSTERNVNRLSAARLFLFGARDVWFVVGVPLYFYGVLSDGTEAGMRRAFFLVGAFMAAWVIGYGTVQASAPALLGRRDAAPGRAVGLVQFWCLALAAIPLALALAAAMGGGSGWLAPAVLGGLLAFGLVFALNSALHSYLILAFSKAGRVTLDVGFYYMSNAAGRLLGTLLSGLCYQAWGLAGCLGAAALLVLASWLCTLRLDRPAA